MKKVLADEQLVKQALDGDLESFAQLVSKYERRIYRLVFGILKQREDAEEVTQDAFTQAFKALPKFRHDATFFTWLFRIALNQALTAARLNVRRSEYVDADSPESTEGADLSRMVVSNSPMDHLDYQQTISMIEKILSKMPKQFADSLMLRAFSGLSYQEIADVGLVSINTVRTRIFRARAILYEGMLERPRRIASVEIEKRD